VGCAHSSATLDRVRLAPIERVAVVQYALNPAVPGMFRLDAAAVGMDAAVNGRSGWPSLGDGAGHYDRSGVKVWSDQAYGRAGWTSGREREEEYFTSALEVFRDHLADR
jgi:hypothetical protein